MAENTAAVLSYSADVAMDLQHKLDSCPVCECHQLDFLFVGQGTPIVKCHECGLTMRNPQPTDRQLDKIYSADYFLGGHSPELIAQVNHLKRLTAKIYLNQIEHYLAAHQLSRNVKLLEIGCGHGNLLIEAREKGWEIAGLELSSDAATMANSNLGSNTVVTGSIDNCELPKAYYNVCVLADVLEHTRNPAEFISEVNQFLQPGGILFVALPSLDSLSARLMRERWMEYKTEHIFYFDRQTVTNLLFSQGFENIITEPCRKVLTLEYINKHFERFTVPLLSPMLRLAAKLMPARLLSKEITVVASGITAIARRAATLPPKQRNKRLTVIVPVYNERETFSKVMTRLLAKEITGVDIDVIIVESNSADGSKDEACKYQGHPRVTLILEDRPRGKGHAVRAGLARATGDFVIIQDADLEYDINDYDDLLKPLVRFQKAFVLGSRHSTEKSWKIRHFADQKWVSFFMNLGHVFFTSFFNILYGQRLRDPFTMFKVFRRDCVHNIRFECNRFDFDCELIAKLVRSGFVPIELPVNYSSRSFKDGKKVSFFGDPHTYFLAFLKYRLTSSSWRRE